MSVKKRTPDERYELMSRAIAYLRVHAKDRPGDAEVARAVGMASAHFKRAFAEWVGITPRRFLAYLTKERAKTLLAEGVVLDASRKAGLSGPVRLHDLMVAYEAVSPGEFKKGNIEIRYGLVPSPFGTCVIGRTARGVCALSFMDGTEDGLAVRSIRESWPKATLIRDDSRVRPYAKRIFGSHKGRSPLPLLLKGTNFQVKVWEALLAIPEGKVARYADIARRIGAPKAVRAVGTACGKNPIGFIIPCHRVLTSEGELGGYHWGTTRKEAMLAWESARTNQ